MSFRKSFSMLCDLSVSILQDSALSVIDNLLPEEGKALSCLC